MAIYRVDSSVASSGNGSTWALAYKTLGEAMAVATAAGDVIYVSHQHDEQLAANATYTIDSAHVIGNPLRVVSVNKASNVPTPGAFVGNSTTARNAVFTGLGISLYLYGISISFGGTTASNIVFYPSGAGLNEYILDSCAFGINSNVASSVNFGTAAISRATFVVVKDSQFTFGNSAQTLSLINAVIDFDNCIISAGTTHPDVALDFRACGSVVTMAGCDLSNVGTLAKSSSRAAGSLSLNQCRLKAGAVAIDQTITAIVQTTIVDCASGDSHGTVVASNERGTLVTNTGIYCNDNISGNLSWSIMSSALASLHTPFVSPWISVYHDGVSAITPYLEILRSGSSTAFTDAEVWAEWSYKGTSGSTRATIGNDGATLFATPSNQTASSKTASDWTGENATSWFGKIGPSSAITPAEAGDLSFRVCVGAPNVTVYVDPQIRGLS